MNSDLTTDQANKNSAFRFVLAIFLPLASCAVQWLLWGWISPFVWFLFFPTVFFSAWLSGMAGGLVSTVISTALVWYFFIPPQLSWTVNNPNNLFSVAIFIIMGFFFSYTFNLLKKANRRAEESLNAAESANVRLQESNEKISALYEKTKEIDTLKTQFFSNVSHELRTPLALILGPISKWLKNDALQGQSRSELEIVERNARLLHRQVNDLLDVAKLEAGRMSMQYAQTDMAHQVRVIASHFSILAEERSINYSVEADSAVPAQMDIEKFHRIVLNLLSNAFKFTPKQGSIRVNLQQSDERAFLQVTDTGSGIPEDKKDLIFESFRQIDGASSRQYGGTGLGLSIVREFVTLHGGSVSVENVPEGGAKFTATFPLLAPSGKDVLAEEPTIDPDKINIQLIDELRAVKAPEHINIATKSATQSTVLVVEDNPDMNSFICSTLQPQFHVLSAFNGNEGLQATIDNLPDLILSDIMMPGMSGDLMVEEIRRHPELKDIPIIILTAKVDDDLQIKMLSSGINDFIRKPFLPDELLARISTILTERLESRKKLYLSEDRFVSLVKASPTGIYLTDREGNCQYVNERWSDITGISQDNALRDGWPSNLHPDDRQCVFNAWNNAVINKSTFNLEYRFKQENGESHWVYGQAVPLIDLSGEITGYVGTITDISERKQAEEELREKESRFRSIFDNSPIAIGISDINNGQLIDVNDAWLRLFGFERNEVIGQSSAELGLYVNRADRNVIVKILSEHGSVVNHMLQLKRKTGDILEILYSAEIITLGSKPYLQVMMTDITERKHIDEEIKNIKTLLEQSFEQSPIPKVLITMPDAIFHKVNPACLDFLGMKNEPSVIGTSFLSFKPSYLDFDNKGNQGLMENLPLARALRGEKTINEERRIIRKDGTERWGLVSGVPIRDEKGAVIAGYLVIMDITDSKSADGEIKRLTVLLDESQHIAQVGGWEIDLINNELHWTDETFRIHDMSPEEYSPTIESAIAFYDPESLPIIKAAVKEAVEKNKNFNLELKMVTAKGRPILVHTTCKVIREHGKPVKVIGAFRDITEQKHLEEQLRQSQKMEAVGQLAGGVAHDFNNILQVIMGYGTILKMDYEQTNQQKEAIDQIISSAEKAANLTRGLLAFSRKQVIYLQQANLNDIIHHSLKFLSRVIGEDIQLKSTLNGAILPVKVDRGQIEQVLVNLATNARDAMQHGGLLSIETELQEVDESFEHSHGYGKPGRYAVISVSDSGSGMDRETCEKIFEPFFTTKELGKGTGLGMAIVYGIVKQHNGFINVYSEPGHGTAFRIYLPIAETEQGDPVKKSVQEMPTGGTETILLAEDDADVRKLVTTVLTQRGYNVISAIDGDAVVEAFAGNLGKVNLIIMDMIMPKKNGREAYDAICQLKSGVKVLYSSGYTADFIENRGVSEENIELLMKPVQPIELLRKVREMLDSDGENPDRPTRQYRVR
ncbi:MAG: PAS domain S-box protein [Pedobacter sp.]